MEEDYKAGWGVGGVYEPCRREVCSGDVYIYLRSRDELAWVIDKFTDYEGVE